MEQKELQHIFRTYGRIIQGIEINEFDILKLEEIARSVLVYYLKQLKFFGLNHEQIIKNLI